MILQSLVSSIAMLFASWCSQVGQLQRRLIAILYAWVLFLHVLPIVTRSTYLCRGFWRLSSFRECPWALCHWLTVISLAIIARQRMILVHTLACILGVLHVAHTVLVKVLLFDQRKVSIAFNLRDWLIYIERLYVFIFRCRLSIENRGWLAN